MKIAKTLYLEPFDGSIDNDLRNALDEPSRKARGKQQEYLRDRLRTGHILYQLLGEAMGRSLQDLHNLDEDQQWLMLDSIISHAQVMKTRSPRKPAPTATRKVTDIPKPPKNRLAAMPIG